MLYNLIKSQFPEHIRENYPVFVDFVKTYYKWMEIQFSEKLESIVDVDATTDTIRLYKTFDGQNVSIADFVQEIVVGRTSGAKAIVKRGLVGVQYITLFIKYITADVTFIDGEDIYVEQDDQSASSNYQATLAQESAIGKVSSDFVEYFKSYLDINGLFNNSVGYSSLFLKNIKQIYTSKGSEQALVFMLEAVHNAAVGIIYPGDSVLKASDGQWYQESFITINTLYGALPDDTTSLYVKTGNKFRVVKTVRIQVLDSTTTRVFFRAVDNIRVVENDIVQFRDINGFTVFQATVSLSPIKIEVIAGGRNWRVGQLLNIPGTVENTIARVTQVDRVGSIKNIDIIQAGYNHPINQHAIASPYDASLSGVNSNIVSELISTNPDVYQHNLIIRDSIDGVSEIIRFSAAGYFDETGPKEDHYVEFSFDNPYNLEVLFTQQFNPSPVSDQGSQDDLLASRATVVVKTGPIARIAGAWADDRGQVSNPQIVLEDNFYFQQFSYVIDSKIAPSKYIDIASAIHPAGMQMFTNATLETSLSITPTASSVILYKELSFFDPIEPQDQLQVINQAHRTFQDVTPIVENISNQFTPADFVESLTATDAGGVVIEVVVSPSEEVILIDSPPERTITKTITDLDVTSVTDQLSSTNTATLTVLDDATATQSITVTKTP